MAETTTINVFSEVKDGNVTFAASSGINVVETTLAAYEALATKDANTLYVITSPGSSSSS